MFRLGTKALISNEEMNDIMKIVKPLGILIKDVWFIDKRR